MSEGVDRKLTTIVATDVVEYSRLVRENEEATIRAMRAHRQELFNPLIEKHGGRIANTAGDSLLIEFSSPVEAVRCATAMQQGLAERNQNIPDARRINIRIGINIGDVVENGSDLLGDGVNVAARLEALADPGGINLSRAVRDQIRDHLNLTLEDLGEVRVKNISRPVRIFKLSGGDACHVGKSQNNGRWSVNVILSTALVLMALAGGGIWWWQKTDFEPADPAKLEYKLPTEPSIAVLPFDNLSGDPAQNFLAAGFSEDILTSLSKLTGLFVISESSTSKLGGKEFTAKRVAENFGVRYILKGSLQKIDDKIRISARLVDAIDGQFVWSDRYDRMISDLFAVKDEITLKIIANIGAKLELGERDRVRSRETDNLEAWLLQREGYRTIQKFNAESNVIGRKLLEEAVRLDPKFATAYANLALSYRLDYQFGWVDNRQAANKTALELLNKALEINPAHGPAMASLASWYLTKGDVKKAVSIARKAVPLEPSDYFVHAIFGWTLIHAGDAERAVEELNLSLRLSPRGPDWVVYKLAEAYLIAGDAAEASRVAQRLLDRPPSSRSNKNLTHIIQALAFNALGNHKAAKREVELAVASFPKRTVTVWTKQRPYADKALQKEWSAILESLGMP